MNIAFATDHDRANYAEDDRLLVDYLIQHGEKVSPVIWNDPEADWESYDVIVFRSVWDYFILRDEFDLWLKKLEDLRVRVFNPLSVIAWNKNKTYFDHFKSLGIKIPAYQIIRSKDPQSLVDILTSQGWDKAVIKPAISGGAHNTWVTDTLSATSHSTRFDQLVSQQDVIVQKFSNEIINTGEWSLIFFNKKFSHAICKQAKAGEFRVQAQFGGQHRSVEPHPQLLAYVSSILDLIPEDLLYARVDGFIADDDQFYLMELELIEPVLFFDSHGNACSNFYRALKEMMASWLL